MQQMFGHLKEVLKVDTGLLQLEYLLHYHLMMVKRKSEYGKSHKYGKKSIQPRKLKGFLTK